MPEIWDTSCPDWEDRIMSRRPLVSDLPLFRPEADRALRIFKRLRVPDIFGNPTLGEACPEWFLSIVAALFGSYDPVSRFRYIQEVFLLIPKGNSKSSYGAPLMLTGLILNDVPGVEMDLVSTTKTIADRIFDQIKNTIKLDNELTKAFHIQDGARTIVRRLNDAELVVKAADTDVITGGKQLATFVDETHEFAARSDAAKIFTEIRGALGKRNNGFFLQATTQSKKEPSGQFADELQNARAVRDGLRRDRLLPILYELPKKVVEAEEWRKPEFWPLVNPNFGKSVSEDYLQREMRKAEDGTAEKMQLFASQHLNVEIGLALSSDRWVGADFWEKAEDNAVSLDTMLETCEVITAGIDGGGMDDLLGLSFVGRERGTKRWVTWSWACAHQVVLHRRKSEAPKLLDMVKVGEMWMVATDDAEKITIDGENGPFEMPEDIGKMIALVKKVDDTGLLHTVGLDPAGVGTIVDALAAIGIGSEADKDSRKGRMRVVGVSQGWQMTGAIKTAERKLADGTLSPAKQGLMRWCVGNAKVEPRGNAIIITKQKSGTAKIDPLMAMFNAVRLMSLNPEPDTSVYTADRGLVFF